MKLKIVGIGIFILFSEPINERLNIVDRKFPLEYYQKKNKSQGPHLIKIGPVNCKKLKLLYGWCLTENTPFPRDATLNAVIASKKLTDMRGRYIKMA